MPMGQEFNMAIGCVEAGQRGEYKVLKSDTTLLRVHPSGGWHGFGLWLFQCAAKTGRAGLRAVCQTLPSFRILLHPTPSYMEIEVANVGTVGSGRMHRLSIHAYRRISNRVQAVSECEQCPIGCRASLRGQGSARRFEPVPDRVEGRLAGLRIPAGGRLVVASARHCRNSRPDQAMRGGRQPFG